MNTLWVLLWRVEDFEENSEKEIAAGYPLSVTVVFLERISRKITIVRRFGIHFLHISQILSRREISSVTNSTFGLDYFFIRSNQHKSVLYVILSRKFNKMFLSKLLRPVDNSSIPNIVCLMCLLIIDSLPWWFKTRQAKC